VPVIISFTAFPWADNGKAVCPAVLVEKTVDLFQIAFKDKARRGLLNELLGGLFRRGKGLGQGINNIREDRGNGCFDVFHYSGFRYDIFLNDPDHRHALAGSRGHGIIVKILEIKVAVGLPLPSI